MQWEIAPGHFAERFQLFVIIVLGESIVVTGATASDAGLDAGVVLALGCCIPVDGGAVVAVLRADATSAMRRIAEDALPGQTGRDAYTYLHLPIVAGILLAAVGDELVLAHPDDPLHTAGALVVLGGPALYLLGLVAFGARVGRRQPWTRPAAAALLVAAMPLAARADGLAGGGPDGRAADPRRCHRPVGVVGG